MRPAREHATSNGQTYMITSSTWGRRSLFSRDVWAKLLIDTLYHYRGTEYLLPEFVVMPDHIHLLLTPKTSLEKAVQFIKGGFSYRGKKELGSNLEIWQKGFSDHRIRDAGDYRLHAIYLRQNPVRKGLCERAEEYAYSSASSVFELDPTPQGLKPGVFEQHDAARLEGVPSQNKTSNTSAQGVPSQSNTANTAPEGAPLQNNPMPGTPEAFSVQIKAASRRVEVATPEHKTRTA
jgi:putative transposase